MRKFGPTLIALALAVALPSTEYAKGAQRGAIEGAERVAEAGGPAGAAMGGGAGGVVGERAGLLDVDQWPRFREYVIRQHYVSNHYDRPVAVGDILPGPAEYYAIPPEFRVRGYYRYAIVNDHTVIVDLPGTRVVMQVID
jgi:hypothetical protein